MTRPLSAFAVIVALLMLTLPGARAGAADQDTGRAILRERDQRIRPRAEEYIGEVTVTSKDGKVRRKVWRSVRSGPPGDFDRLIRFLSPPDVRGVGYLAHMRRGQDPDEWLYLPSMKRERRITARDRDGAFAGTSFSYEDLDLLELDETRYDARWVSTASRDGVRVHTIELTPRAASAYAKKVLTIRADDLALLTVEFYGGRPSTLVKRLTFSGHTDISGYRRPTRFEMADLKKDTRTVVTLHDIVLDRVQPADRFTIRNLLREDDEGAPAGSRPRAPASFRQERGQSAPPSDADSLHLPGGFSGSVEGRSFGLFGDRATRASTLWGTLSLRQTARIGPARLVAAVRLESASSSQIGALAFDPADRDPDRSPISIRELSLAMPIGRRFDLQVGRFLTTWGANDGYSPADAFLPRDLADPLTEDRLSLWGASLRGEFSRWRVEALVVPVTTPWRLPELNGRQSPLAVANVVIDERPWEVPVRGFQAGRVVARLAGWDVAFWGHSGVRPAPVLVPVLDGVNLESPTPVLVPLERRFATEHGGGTSLSHAAGPWMVHGELGIFRSSDPSLGDAAIWTLGASRLVGNGTVTATLAVNSIETPVNPLLMFDRALLPCVIVATREYQSWGSWDVAWVATFRTVGGVLSGEVTKDLSDALKATIGADLPHGATLSPATAFSGGQRVRAGVRWSW